MPDSITVDSTPSKSGAFNQREQSYSAAQRSIRICQNFKVWHTRYSGICTCKTQQIVVHYLTHLPIISQHATIVHSYGRIPLEGIPLDLGLSSMQLSAAEWGFSFQHEGPFELRFDPNSPTNAADLVNNLSRGQLADLLCRFGEERRSRAIARAVVAARPLHTTRQLADTIGNCETDLQDRTHSLERWAVSI